MKKPLCLRLFGATTLFIYATFAASGPKPQPQPPSPRSGTIVLDLPNAFNWGLTVAPSGMIYTVGNSWDGSAVSPGRQLVLGSSDNGSSWSLLDDYAPPGQFVDFWFGLGGGIASDSVGNLYVSSFTYDDASYNRAGWYVRRSIDGGLTWATVADFAVAPVSSSADDVAVAADGAGDVYVAACDVYLLNSVWYHDWTIRKGIGGTSFSTIDVLPNSYPKDIFVHPTAGIFVVGQTKITNKSATSYAWLVRRSTSDGATWSNVDTFQLSSSRNAVAMGIGADSAGNLYVVGSGSVLNKGINSSHWLVRKSTNGGNSWTTVDDYQLAADSSSEARCMATDANGNLFVAGYSRGDLNHWIVRKSVGGTGPWTTVDDFQYGGSHTRANAIAADALGNVFVGGHGGAHWLIKRY